MVNSKERMAAIEGEMASFLIVADREPTLENQILTLEEMYQRRLGPIWDGKGYVNLPRLAEANGGSQHNLVMDAIFIRQYIDELKLSVPSTVNFHQYSDSPASISGAELYRQTVAMAKAAFESYSEKEDAENSLTIKVGDTITILGQDCIVEDLGRVENTDWRRIYARSTANNGQVFQFMHEPKT